MPIKIMMVRQTGGGLYPATDHDQDLFKKLKTGQTVRVELTMVSARSLQHHRLYYGGLLQLAFDYWNPSGGLVSSAEMGTLKRFADWLDKKGGDTGAFRRGAREFVKHLSSSRAEKIQAPEKTIEALHRWVKVQCDYYTLESTPDGIRKEPKSINFNAMNQDEFNEFYKAAFGVIWNLVLSSVFKSEQEARNAIDQLTGMG